MSIGSIRQTARSTPSSKISSSRTALPSRLMRRSSTLPIPAPQNMKCRAISAFSTSPTARRLPTAATSAASMSAIPTASVSMSPAISGRVPPTACTAFRPTEPCSARSGCRRRCPTSPSAAPRKPALHHRDAFGLFDLYQDDRRAISIDQAFALSGRPCSGSARCQFSRMRPSVCFCRAQRMPFEITLCTVLS